MSIESKLGLSEETISNLQKLIRANLDAYDGFRESAQEIQDAAVGDLFRDLAFQRSQLATELQEYVRLNHEKAVEEGSLGALVHRAWINVRSKLSSGDPYAILIEAERGEDSIKQAYEEVLKETAGSAMNDVLQRQYASVKTGHDRVRELRDTYRDNR